MYQQPLRPVQNQAMDKAVLRDNAEARDRWMQLILKHDGQGLPQEGEAE